MHKFGIVLASLISISSCINFDREENTTNYYEYNMTFEQACVLRGYYLKKGLDVPLSVQAVIDESDMECE